MENQFTAIFERCEEGGFHAFIKELPGVHSEGETIEDAQINLVDAFHQLLAYRIEQQLSDKDISKIKRLEAQLV